MPRKFSGFRGFIERIFSKDDDTKKEKLKASREKQRIKKLKARRKGSLSVYADKENHRARPRKSVRAMQKGA